MFSLELYDSAFVIVKGSDSYNREGKWPEQENEGCMETQGARLYVLLSWSCNAQIRITTCNYELPLKFVCVSTDL